MIQLPSDTKILAERASLAEKPGHAVRWKLRPRGEQDITGMDSNAAFDNEGGIFVQINSEYQDRFFSYLRGKFFIPPALCEGVIEYALELELNNAKGLVVLVGLYDDENLLTELKIVKETVLAGDGRTVVRLPVDFTGLPVRQRGAHAVIQVCMTAEPGAQILVGNFTAQRKASIGASRKLRVRYDFFGDEAKASSRLRVWKFVELLRSSGHDVRLTASTDVDVFICQKARPFGAVAAVRKASPKAVIVYDFDDNFLLPSEGVLPEVIAFFNCVDVVTCGSEYLAEIARQWHSNVFVLENPLDVDNADLCRAPRRELARIGWFGAPEGISELRAIDPGVTVETLTRGGDIEFDLRTVDRDLTEFDLLLFPVQETPWNLAKNANRMMKAVALGVPVLASATPEQRRIAALIGLSKECLVETGQSWSDAIARLRKRYAEAEKQTLAAREKLWASHSTETILGGLLQHLEASTTLEQASPPRNRLNASEQKRVAAMVVDGEPVSRVTQTFAASSLDWSAFQDVGVFSTAYLDNQLLGFGFGKFAIGGCDFLSVFAQADAFMAQSQADYLLVIPPGTALNRGVLDVLSETVRRGDAALTVFARNGFCNPTLTGSFGAYPVQELLARPHPVGPLLVNRQWVLEQKIRWSECFGLWPWVVATKAMAMGAPTRLVPLPLAFDAAERPEVDVSAQYAAWLSTNQPALAKELPDIKKQWARMLADIIADTAAAAAQDLPYAYGELYGRFAGASQRLSSMEREIRALKADLDKARSTSGE